MLTKDLIVCRSLRGVLKPQFLPVDSAEWQELARQLLVAYDVENHPTRGDIDELTSALVSGSGRLQVAKGLLKTVDDRAEYTSPQELDYAAERRRLYGVSAELIRSGRYADEGAFQAALRERTAESPLSGGPYFADLPENDRLSGFGLVNARQVLERYNLGLVQGLLLRASRLELEVRDSEPVRLRRMLRYVKFFQLLARGERDARTGGVHLTVDGPASVLEQTKRYGLQLANFFPAVCALNHWRLCADVEWKEREQQLILDESSGLVCPYHNFIAFAPEEIRLFERHFKESASEWRLSEETPFLTGDDGELIFPDFSFEHTSGDVVHLELFHRWHATQLLKRLELCEKRGDLRLVLGVDRSLLRDEELAARLEASPWFARHGYLFRDYPTVEKTLKALRES